jgi:parallel beta-helix repeat protein
VGNESSFNAKVFSRAASGIRLHSSRGNTVASNVAHDNEDFGLEIVTGSNNKLLVNNVSYGNGDHGIDNLASTGGRIVGNSVYDHATAGINAEGNSLQTHGQQHHRRQRDRQHAHEGQHPGRCDVDQRDHDRLRPGAPAHLGRDARLGNHLVRLAERLRRRHRTGEPRIRADPRWAAAASGNLRLTADSPAIDSADSGASAQSSTDAAGRPRVDDPLRQNTGAGPRAYDDRGAYEYLLETRPARRRPRPT